MSRKSCRAVLTIGLCVFGVDASSRAYKDASCVNECGEVSSRVE